MPIVLTGGASGGHVFPAIALAEYLSELRFGDGEVRVVLPQRLLFQFTPRPHQNYRAHRVPGIGFNISKFWNYPLVAGSWMQLFNSLSRLLDEIKPDVIVCFGTFLTVAATVWAKRNGVPVITHEQNALLGRANRLALNWVNGLAMGLPGAVVPHIRNGVPKVRVCGEVIRKEFKNQKREKTDGLFCLLMLGGSQGSGDVNEIFCKAVSGIEDRIKERIFCIHVAGRNGMNSVSEIYQANKIKHEVYDYHPETASLYARADLVIGRTGAGTMAETSAFRLPFIAIPHPSKHQLANARYLSERNAAYVISGSDNKESQLRAMLTRLFDDSRERERLASALQTAVPTDGAERLADWVGELLTKESACV